MYHLPLTSPLLLSGAPAVAICWIRKHQLSPWKASLTLRTKEKGNIKSHFHDKLYMLMKYLRPQTPFYLKTQCCSSFTRAFITKWMLQGVSCYCARWVTLVHDCFFFLLCCFTDGSQDEDKVTALCFSPVVIINMKLFFLYNFLHILCTYSLVSVSLYLISFLLYLYSQFLENAHLFLRIQRQS